MSGEHSVEDDISPGRRWVPVGTAWEALGCELCGWEGEVYLGPWPPEWAMTQVTMHIATAHPAFFAQSVGAPADARLKLYGPLRGCGCPATTGCTGRHAISTAAPSDN